MHINEVVGGQIRLYRKKRGYSLEELAGKLYKSKSIVSKYELGQANIDIATLHEIADALDIDVKLLLDDPMSKRRSHSSRRFGIFTEPRLYLYLLEVMRHKPVIHRGILVFNDETAGITEATLYMDIPEGESYQKCGSVYSGRLYCSPYTASMLLTNPLDEADQVNIFASINRSQRNTSPGQYHSYMLLNSQPVSTDLILSKEPISNTEALRDALTVDKERIALLKKGNMYSAREYIDEKPLFSTE